MARCRTRQHDGRGNHILDALPSVERDRLIAGMTVVDLPVTTVLFEPGAPIDAVYFPMAGVISLVTPLDGGAIVEVASIGNEGIVGVPHVAGGSLAVRAISVVGGSSLRMDGGAFSPSGSTPARFVTWSRTTSRGSSARCPRQPPVTGCAHLEPRPADPWSSGLAASPHGQMG